MQKKLPSLGFLILLGASTVTAQSTAAPVAREAAEYRFAVTLISSFDPIPESMLPRDIPEKIYRTQVSVFGRNIYFVRMGFYATAGEADLAKQRVQARFPAALVTEITSDEYLKVTGGKPKTPPVAATPPATPTSTPAPAATAPATTIAKPMAPIPAPAVSIPVPAPTTAITTTPAAATPTPTPEIKPQTVVTAPAPKTPVAPVAVTPAPAAKTSPAVVSEADKLMEQARDAMTRGDNTEAITLLNKLLRLPPNAHSQDAQELVGLAHERRNEIASARQEYNLYLRLYPEGPGSDRVRQRLAALEVTAPPRVAFKKPSTRDAGPASIRGSFSQYYYYGQSQTDSNTTVLGPSTSTSFSSTDQSALYNNIDVRARANSGNWDHRFVFRDTYAASFLSDVESYNRLYSAYYEVANRVGEYSGRIGRQPGNSGGVLNRFDGILLGYNILPKFRVNVVAGNPVDFYPTPYSKSFLGANVDLGLFANHWNGNIYYIKQTVDGVADRQALGSELRYFDPKGSASLYLDYDTLFGEFNIASFQATWLSSTSTTWNMLLDHRLAPTLMTSNALFSAPIGSTIKSLLTTNTEEQLHQQAAANSPIFETYMLGMAHNLNTTWQVGGDIRRFSLSAPPSSPTITTSLGTGASMMYTAQAIANGIFRQRDLSVFSLSYLSGETYTGETLTLTHRMLFQDRWTLDLALSYYQQQNQPVISVTDPGTIAEATHSTTTDTSRLTPMIRLSYRWRTNMVLESELSYEMNTDHVVDNNLTAGSSARLDTDTSRHFFMLGYRWDF